MPGLRLPWPSSGAVLRGRLGAGVCRGVACPLSRAPWRGCHRAARGLGWGLGSAPQWLGYKLVGAYLANGSTALRTASAMSMPAFSKAESRIQFIRFRPFGVCRTTGSRGEVHGMCFHRCPFTARITVLLATPRRSAMA